MVLPGHIGGGYLTARLVLLLAHATFSPTQTAILLLIGTLAGEAPDIDIALYYFNRRSQTSKKVDEHRDYPTHAPLVWLVLCLIIVAIGYAFSLPFLECIGWVILAGSWSHLILDSIEYGIPWLWPFDKKWYSMRKIQPKKIITAPKGTLKSYWQFTFGPYLEGWTVYFEIAITLVAVWTFFH
jgi:hypothetical protein